MRFKLDRSFYMPKERTILQETDNAIIYGYAFNGKVAAIAFKGKAQKPAWHHTFKSELERQEYIDRWFKQLDQREQYNLELKQARQTEILEADIKLGDYFYTSWGYDQTNIDYMVVVSVTAKTCICRMVSPIHVGESGQEDVLTPGTAYGESFRMQISGLNSLTGSYPFCQGSKRRDIFQKTKLGSTNNQTMAMYGH